MRPLVSIGLPTYNRAEKLARAMEFLLAQDYRQIEVVISDNASTDSTAEVCERLRRLDSRVRYIRQPSNIGPTANYRKVLEAATGDLYMATADDDWPDADYVSKCVDALRSSDLILVCGRSRMYKDGKFSHDSFATSLTQDSPSDRVVEYYRTVTDNGAFHGLIRRQALLDRPEMPRTMGGDWPWMASIAFSGKIDTLESTGIIKHQGGATRSWEDIVRTLGLPAWQARYWTEAILGAVLQDIARSPVYAPLGPTGRLQLAARVALALGLKWKIWLQWRTYVGQWIRAAVRR